MGIDITKPIFGFWKIKKKIGEGTYGTVYEMERVEENPYTHEKKTHRSALKVITIPQKESEIDTLRGNGMDNASVENYYRSCAGKMYQEIELMAQLKGTSHIVSYENHQMVPHEDDPGWDILIQMELLIPLVEFAKYNPMDLEFVAKMGIDMCEALELCEKNNIIHRDIKPENIFLTANGDFKLGDFGIAKTAAKSTQGTLAGTYNYMAPEIFLNRPYNHSVDIYSVGLVLYRFLNHGRGMFMPQNIEYGDSEKALEQRMRNDPIPAPAEGDQWISDIILKACSFYPQNRFQTATEMKDALVKWKEGHMNASYRPQYAPPYTSQNEPRGYQESLQVSQQYQQSIHNSVYPMQPEAEHMEAPDIAMSAFCVCSMLFILVCLFYPEWITIFS